jgi:AcrR family transcriptional regulator
MKAVRARRTVSAHADSQRQVGRPRGFNEKKALDAALRVFWKKGYEGASLSDLTRAMRIERPSLYGTFGNKEALFRKVLDRYSCTVAGFIPEAFSEPTARGVVERMLLGTADVLSAPGNQPCCMFTQSVLSSGDESAVIRKEISIRGKTAEAGLRKRLERAKREGDLRADANTGDLVRYVYTVNHGMAVQAKAGATRAQLRQIAKTALRAWPASRKK